MLYQFKIQLQDISDPPVWRRVTVPAQFNFMQLHEVIQYVFGWEDYHLYQFSSKGYGSDDTIVHPHDEDGIKADEVKLTEVFSKKGQKFIYIYDFGDDWIHTITLEDVIDEKKLKATCLDGKGACPPEDCGGPFGYERLKEIVKNSDDPEYDEIREWLMLDEDEEWDSEAFTKEEMADINEILVDI